MPAKKKKPTRKKKIDEPVIERSPIWAYVGMVVMVMAALFMLLGGVTEAANPSWRLVIVVLNRHTFV